MKIIRVQSGNILFLILLAVVLFAALVYAVTSSMRGGGSNASKESAQSAAAEIINYSTLLENTIGRLRLSNDCKLSEISFNNTVVSGYSNSSTRADNTCSVFEAAGGNMAWKKPNPKWLEDSATAAAYSQAGIEYGVFSFPSNAVISQIGNTASASSASGKSLIVGLKYLRQDICDAINAQLGLTTNTTPSASTIAGDGTKYKGWFASPGYYNAGSVTSGKRTYCANTSATGYTFYHVLDINVN